MNKFNTIFENVFIPADETEIKQRKSEFKEKRKQERLLVSNNYNKLLDKIKKSSVWQEFMRMGYEDLTSSIQRNNATIQLSGPKANFWILSGRGNNGEVRQCAHYSHNFVDYRKRRPVVGTHCTRLVWNKRPLRTLDDYIEALNVALESAKKIENRKS